MSNPVSVYYGSISFFIVILHNVFLLYNVDVFVNIYKIDKLSFWIAELIFLLWNSFNDPLFGWLSDRQYLRGHLQTNQQEIVDRRLRALMLNGPLLSIGFLIFWFSWATPFIQFVVCLCAYDGFLTMIELHHSALLADLSISFEVRTKMNMFSSLFSALGSLSVFISYAFWNKSDFGTFQNFCLITSVTALLGFIVSIMLLRRAHKRSNPTVGGRFGDDAFEESDDLGIRDGMKKFLVQLSGHTNFLLFTAMNLVQVFHCHFNSNFFPLFLSILLGENASPLVCSVLLGISFVAPHINNMYFLVVCRRYGAYKVIKFLFGVKFALSLFMYYFGRSSIWLTGLFIASNRVFTEGTCKLLNLVVSDLVDEDVVIHRRKQPVSALIFGTVALFSKPGQTFAPIIGTALLSFYTGHDVFGARKGAELPEEAAGSRHSYSTEYQEGVFRLLIVVPVFCSVLQLLAWNFFDLHGQRLNLIKSLRSNLKLVASV